MKGWKLLWLVLLGCAVADAATAQQPRSVVPVESPPIAIEDPFDRDHSVAVLVGVGTFADSRLKTVPYAVDDAIDLAYVLAIEGKAPLVRADRMVLALAGKPRKHATKEHLEELKAAGTTVRGGGKADIMDALQQQARAVGANGMFIVAFATHGYSIDGVHYLLTETSSLQDAQTAISTPGVIDLAAYSPRSLLFVDACRERITAATRSVAAGPETSAPRLSQRNGVIKGQVVFYAASAGGYAYDCDRERNGCFTAAVLDGLRGKAERDEHGAITVEALQEYAGARLKQHDPPGGIQVNCDRDAKKMVLAFGTPDHAPDLAAVEFSGSWLHGLGGDKSLLWKRDLQAAIVDAKVTDLDGDGRSEAVACVAPAGGGRIVVLDAIGDPIWLHETREPAKVVIDDLRQTKREIAALTDGAITILNHRGKVVSTLSQPASIQDLLFGRQTSRHLPRLIATTSNHAIGNCAGAIFAVNPRNGDELWYGCSPEEIRAIATIDHDNDGNTELRVTTAAGEVFYLDFNGRVVEGSVPFTPIAPRKRAAGKP